MVVIRSGCLLRVFISISDEFIDRVILYLRRWCVLEGIRTALAWINEDRSVFAWSGIGRCRIYFKSILDKAPQIAPYAPER